LQVRDHAGRDIPIGGKRASAALTRLALDAHRFERLAREGRLALEGGRREAAVDFACAEGDADTAVRPAAALGHFRTIRAEHGPGLAARSTPASAVVFPNRFTSPSASNA